ncbi:MAG: discoidin domain-containing protein, partial [Bacteroidales bacterium]|nr:discoidin domain-containing protein [Bacteroidales bacterium]
MKKHFLWALTLALIALFPYQNVKADYCVGTAPNNGDGDHYGLNTIVVKVNGEQAFSYTKSQTIEDASSSCVMQIKANDVITFVVTGGTHTQWGQAVVYFDWNQNQDWTDSGESTILYSKPLSVQSNAEFTITVPSDFTWQEGVSELKVRVNSGEDSSYNSNGDATPCTALTKGRLVTFKAIPLAGTRTINVYSNPSAGGTLTVNGSGTTVTAEGNITIEATPASGYEFVNWTLNGEEVSTSATYTDITDGDKTYTANFRKVLDRSGWEITVDGEGYDSTNSSSSVEGPKSNMIDGLTNTFWHSYYSGQSSSWGNENLPHYVQFNLGSIQEFDKFKYVSRNASTSQNGNIVNYQLYISNSDMTSSLGDGSIPTNGTLISSGAFTYDGSSAEHMVDLGQLYTGQYIFFLATSENGSQNKFANCAEFYLYQYNFDVTINVAAGEGGSAEITAGGSGTSATISSGASVTLTATPAEGYGFVNWTNSAGQVVSNDATYTFTATSNETYTANFAEKIIVTIESNDDAMGTVRFSEGEGTTKEVGSGASVTITAEPVSSAYEFVQWNDGSTEATRTIDNITESVTYTATFAERAVCTVIINTPEVAGGTVSYTVNGNEPTGTIYEGDELVFTASVNPGYKFVQWSNGSTDNPYTVTATGNIDITPVYAKMSQDEMYAAMPIPTFTKFGNLKNTRGVEILSGAKKALPGVIDLSGLAYVTNGNQTDAEGNMVKVPTGATDPIYISPGADFDLKLTIYAGAWHYMKFFQYHNTFQNQQVTYGTYGASDADASAFWTDVAADNTVTYDQDSSTITFPIELGDDVVSGDIIVLRAMSSGTENMEANGSYGEGLYLDILFYVVEPEVSVTASPAEGGIATANGGTATFTSEIGATVNLNAQANDSYGFVNWTMDGNEIATDAETTVVVATQAPTYTANFARSYRVSIASSDETMGTVSFLNEEGVTEKEVAENSEVTVVATPASSAYKFVEWSNGVTTAEQTVTVTADLELIATFVAKTEYTVTIPQVTGGSVLCTVGGEEVDAIYEGDEVTLTATPATGYEFVRWTDENGTLISANNPYTFTATANITIKPVYESVPVEHDLFNTSNTGGTYPHRIPGIVKTSTGRLIAVAARLVCGTDPGYGQVDVVCRTSDNNGENWSDIRDVAVGTGVTSATENYFDTAFGDPAIVADRESEEVVIIAVAGCTVYNNSATTRSNPNKIALIRSTDNGENWDDPIDITENVYSLFDNGNPIESAFVAGGKVFQSRIVKKGNYYRLYAAMCARPNGNRVIYSDDFGRTWKPLGGEFALPVPGGDEPKCEELPDGRVIVSSRTSGGRIYNIYTYTNTATAAGSWGTSTTCTFSSGSNATNGEILVVPVVRNSDSKEMYLALQSLPASTSREDVTIYYRELTEFEDMNSVANFASASAWDGSYKVTDETSAYSSMDLQADNKIAFIYEKNYTSFGTAQNPISTCFPTGSGTHGVDGYDNTYVAFNLEYITNGAYSVKNNINRGAIVKEYLTSLIESSTVSDDVKTELNTKVEAMGDNPTTAEVDAIYSVLYADPWDGKAVTFTNVQQSGTTYVIYVNDSGVLSLGSANATAASLGVSAQFECIKQASGAYTFYNAKSDTYMIYRNRDDANDDAKGTNDNKGTLSTYDATYCDWTIGDGSGTVSGTYYMSAGRPSQTSSSSCQIVLSSGSFDGWGTHEIVYAEGYSNLFKIEVLPESDDTKALIEDAKAVLEKEGLGYPKTTATSRTTLNNAIDKAEANPYEGAATALQQAIDAYYASTDIELPVNEGVYSFIAGHDTKYYLYNNNGTLAIASYSEGTTELPETAKFICEVEGDYFHFRTSDGKYMAFPAYGTENYTDASSDGIEDTASDLTKYSIAKLYNNINSEVTVSNEDLFGSTYFKVLLRGHKTDDGAAESGVIVVDTNDSDFDGAAKPYAGSRYSSAITIVEHASVPERTITVEVVPELSAAITINGEATTSLTAEGKITIVATPAAGYGFKNWTDENGVVVSTESTLIDNTEGDKIYTANLLRALTVTATSNNTEWGTAHVEGGNNGLFVEGTEATLVATPENGCRFVQWTLNGYTISTQSTYKTVIMQNENYVAEFVKEYIDMKLYYALSNDKLSNEERANRYLQQVTAVAGKDTDDEITTVVFDAENERGLPRIDAEASAFAANSENGEAVATTTGALIDKTANTIKVLVGTTTLDLNFKAWLSNMTVRGYIAEPELNETQQAIYVDWNNDKTFAGTDEIYGIVEDTYPNDEYLSEDGYNRSIAIPEGIETGTYRMRVIYFDPVGTGYEGWEEMLVNENLSEDDELYRIINQGRAYDFDIKVVSDKNYITFDAPGDTYFTVGDNAEITLTYPVEDAVIYYTVDGNAPDIYSPKMQSGGKVVLNTYEVGEIIVKAMVVVDGVKSDIYRSVYKVIVKDLDPTTVATSTDATTITAASISGGTGIANGDINHTFYQGQQEKLEPIMVTSSASFNLDLTIDLNNYGITVYKATLSTGNPMWSIVYDYIGSTEAALNKDKFTSDLTTKGIFYTTVDDANAIYKVSLPISMNNEYNQGESLLYRVIVSSVSGNISSTIQDFGTGEFLDFIFTVEPKTEEIKFYGTAGSEVSVSLTTNDGCYVSVGGVTANLAASDSLQVETPMNAAGEFTIQAVGGGVASIEIEALDYETEILLPKSDAIKSIIMKSDADDNASTVSALSDLSQGVQVVVEKDIYTPQPVEGKGTPTIFNFMSMPFEFNTSAIKYWDGDSWETAEPENQIRVLLYDLQKRANGDYENTWETVTTATHKIIAANQGFVIVGNNDLGETIKLQFTSAEEAYDGSATSVTANRYRKEEGTTHMQDQDWNFNGVPYLTAGEFAEAYTLYTYDNTNFCFEAHTPTLGLPTLKPYQAVMYQAEMGDLTSKEIAITSASVANLANGADDVYARAYISIDDSNPAKIILCDETSENFVVNEDAWYMPSLINTTPAAYFNVGGEDAEVTVQPAANELPMNVYTGAGTSHRISLTATDGNYNVYLKDAATDETVCLNDEDYTFTATAKTTIADRFTVSMLEPTGIIDAA